MQLGAMMQQRMIHGVELISVASDRSAIQIQPSDVCRSRPKLIHRRAPTLEGPVRQARIELNAQAVTYLSD